MKAEEIMGALSAGFDKSKEGAVELAFDDVDFWGTELFSRLVVWILHDIQQYIVVPQKLVVI